MNQPDAATDCPAWYRTRAGMIALASYAVFLAVVVGLLVYARGRVIAEQGTPEAIAEWRAWRDQVRQQQDQNGAATERPVPTSDEPPQLVLMRDHFAGVLAGTLAVTSFLYGFIAFVVIGMMRQRDPSSM